MSASERRGAARTAVVWGALREVLDAHPDSGRGAGDVLDIGGGTGGFAVRVAELGHRVRVVDPSPDALAALGRRAQESGVADRVTAQQGDLSTLLEVVGPDSVDVVLCHGVLEIVDDPAAALATIARVLRPGGALSLLVAQRHAAVIARAMAGHFQQARSLLEGDPVPGHPGRAPSHRFTREELDGLLPAAGLTPVSVHGVRVFADLVPGSLLDLEPGAAQAMVELEQAVSERPEFLPLATQLHVIATR
jgi:SAM-dependent methyltransferase